MKINKNYAIEIFIIFILILSVALIVSSCKLKEEKKYTYILNFEDIDGIAKGSPVKFMGVIVGYVKELKFNNNKIIADIYISKKDVNIPKCSKAKVEFTGLVGSKSIEITPPDGLKCEEKIISENPLRISEYFNTIQIYNRALEGIDNGLKKFSHKNADYILSEISSNPDTTVLDKVITNCDKLNQDFTNTVSKIIKFENKTINNVDKLNQKIDKD